MKKVYTKESLILLFKKLQAKLCCQPTRRQWIDDLDTPSEMPIRMIFGRWNLFVIECGGIPLKPKISDLARERCIASRVGKVGGNFKTGRFIDRNGYVQIWKPEHKNARMGGYIHEHRLVMSEYIGRPLYPYENVHHKNGIRTDNKIDNLELWDTTQPSGQRVQDKIEWAIEFLKRNNIKVIGNIHDNKELLK